MYNFTQDSFQRPGENRPFSAAWESRTPPNKLCWPPAGELFSFCPPNPFKQKKLRLLLPTPPTRTPRGLPGPLSPLRPAPAALLTPQRPDEQGAVLNQLLDELVGSLQLDLVTLQALPEVRAVQVGIAELQRRQPHGTGAARGRRGPVGAGSQGASGGAGGRGPWPALRRAIAGAAPGREGTAQRKRAPRAPPSAPGSRGARTRGTQAALGARRAQAPGVGRGAGPLRVSPWRRMVAAAPRRRAPGRGRSRKVPSGPQTLPAAPRASAPRTVVCAARRERRRHSGRAGPALPLRGRRLRAPANGTRAPGPSSRFRAPTPLPRPFARSPSGPRPRPALRSQAPRCCGPSAPAGALGGDPVPCWAPGSLWSIGGDPKGSSTPWTRGYKPAFTCPKV